MRSIMRASIADTFGGGAGRSEISISANPPVIAMHAAIAHTVAMVNRRREIGFSGDSRSNQSIDGVVPVGTLWICATNSIATAYSEMEAPI